MLRFDCSFIYAALYLALGWSKPVRAIGLVPDTSTTTHGGTSQQPPLNCMLHWLTGTGAQTHIRISRSIRQPLDFTEVRWWHFAPTFLTCARPEQRSKAGWLDHTDKINARPWESHCPIDVKKRWIGSPVRHRKQTSASLRMQRGIH